MFGSLQTLPSFLNSFGTTVTAGKLGFTTDELAQLNSIPWLGKFVGVFLFSLAVERVGYKKGLLFGTVLQTIGIILEMATTNWRVFCAGRTIIYSAMGVYENVAPLYVAEVSKHPMCFVKPIHRLPLPSIGDCSSRSTPS